MQAKASILRLDLISAVHIMGLSGLVSGATIAFFIFLSFDDEILTGLPDAEGTPGR
jgi:hypothetical protein